MGEVDDPSQDLSSPYHVSSSDNPSFLIVPIILEGLNYHHWSRSFQMSLISKNKIGFIGGTIEAPNRTKSLFPTWQRANMLVVSWILKVISQSIAQSIICMNNAFDIWNDLKERFSQGDMIHVSDIQEMISSFKQVCSLVTQQERQIFGDQSKAMIATSKGGYKNNATTYGRGAGYGRGSNGRGYTSKICSHCGRTGHTIDTCYKKHGFPPHFKFKNQNHDQSHTNAVFQNTNFNNNEQNHEGSRSEVESQQIGFTPEQYQTLLALLQQTKSSGNASNQVSIIPFNPSNQTVVLLITFVHP
ncbi:uncharacterized protein [Phaseolus vulgaris]|uniref:uncharacterized protein n=1 Tax=Phaseolus vulgaris TaxID=3885 RepID=UPI0035CBF8FD